MFKHIEAIKRQEQMTEQMDPLEVMARLIWERALNSKDHFFKIPRYYEYPCFIEYSNDSDAFMLDVYYIGQEKLFSLVQPKYKCVLGITPLIIEWLESVYAALPPETKPRRRRRGSNSRTSAPGSPPLQSALQRG